MESIVKSINRYEFLDHGDCPYQKKKMSTILIKCGDMCF